MLISEIVRDHPRAAEAGDVIIGSVTVEVPEDLQDKVRRPYPLILDYEGDGVIGQIEPNPMGNFLPYDDGDELAFMITHMSRPSWMRKNYQFFKAVPISCKEFIDSTSFHEDRFRKLPLEEGYQYSVMILEKLNALPPLAKIDTTQYPQDSYFLFRLPDKRDTQGIVLSHWDANLEVGDIAKVEAVRVEKNRRTHLITELVINYERGDKVFAPVYNSEQGWQARIPGYTCWIENTNGNTLEEGMVKELKITERFYVNHRDNGLPHHYRKLAGLRIPLDAVVID
tara:strand:- start:2139 stop:2987 length:849 start_codon:yes stop_codon:yes gene_type:complete